MWRFLTVIAIAAGLGYGGYVYWQRSHSAIFHLAPPGTFFLVRYRSVTSASGVTGFAPGTKVSLLRRSAGLMHVTDGRTEFDVSPDDLTNDLDIAARVVIGDAQAQEQIGRLLISQSGFISILSATYGCPERAFNVTAVIQARVAGGERYIMAGNELAGDPDFGCPKTLTVTYAVGGGSPITQRVREGESITFPLQPPPAVVAETPARRTFSRGPNPLDRSAYDQKDHVARPPTIYVLPRRR